MIQYYWSVFAELIATPFEQVSLIWGIVPLYFGLLLNELTSDPDPGRARRAMEAMMGMSKIEIADLERAADGA